MKSKSTIEKSYLQLLQQLELTPVVLLHPEAKYRSVVTARLINDENFNTYYFSFGADDVSLISFIESFIQTMSRQVITFGRKLHMMPYEIYQNLEDKFHDVLDVFLKELESVSNEPYILILDELDRTEVADELQNFLTELINRLPHHCKLVLNGRSLPRIPLLAMIAKNTISIIKDIQIVRKQIFTPYLEAEESTIEIRAFGPSAILKNNMPTTQWEGHLPRLLLYFALDRPVVTRTEICRNFWPDLGTEQAVNVFHVTKRRLHKAIALDVLEHNDNYYQINPKISIYYDVAEFVHHLLEARDKNNPTPEQNWSKVVELYRGPFLHGHNDPWIEGRRLAYRDGYIEALVALSAHYVDQNRTDKALRMLTTAASEDILREDIHQRIMSLYYEIGRRSDAVRHYQELEEKFKSLSKTLSDETVELHQQIINQ